MLITLTLLGVVLFASFKIAPSLAGLVADFTNYEDWNFRGSGGIIKFLNAALSLILGAGMLLTFYLTYKYLVLTILSPFLSYLSDKTENILTGSEYPFEWKQFWSDLLRGLKMSLRNFSREIPITIFLVILGLIPGVAFLSAPLIFIVSGYFVGFSMMDYYYERRRMGVKETAKNIWEQRGFAVSIGAGFNLLFLIPILGLTLAPLFAVVAATIGMVEKEQASLPSQQTESKSIGHGEEWRTETSSADTTETSSAERVGKDISTGSMP